MTRSWPSCAPPARRGTAAKRRRWCGAAICLPLLRCRCAALRRAACAFCFRRPPHTAQPPSSTHPIPTDSAEAAAAARGAGAAGARGRRDAGVSFVQRSAHGGGARCFASGCVHLRDLLVRSGKHCVRSIPLRDALLTAARSATPLNPTTHRASALARQTGRRGRRRSRRRTGRRGRCGTTATTTTTTTTTRTGR